LIKLFFTTIRKPHQELHMKFKLPIALLTLVISSTTLNADEAVATRYALTLDGAKKVAEAAAAYAKANGASPSIAVVDESGYLLYFVRPEGSFAAGANVSIGKAHTAAVFKKATKDFEDIINKGRFTMTALPDFTPLQGGVPIVREGQIVGAVGVSGAKSAQQDEEVAKAGAAAVSDVKTLAKTSGN
jgi:glc operon protein GlcG